MITNIQARLRPSEHLLSRADKMYPGQDKMPRSRSILGIFDDLSKIHTFSALLKHCLETKMSELETGTYLVEKMLGGAKNPTDHALIGLAAPALGHLVYEAMTATQKNGIVNTDDLALWIMRKVRDE